MDQKVVVYVSGYVKSDSVKFHDAVASVRAAGFSVINPTPTQGDLVSRCAGLALIEEADVVYFAPGWSRSVCSQFEMSYCKYTGKLCMTKLDELAEVLK